MIRFVLTAIITVAVLGGPIEAQPSIDYGDSPAHPELRAEYAALKKRADKLREKGASAGVLTAIDRYSLETELASIRGKWKWVCHYGAQRYDQISQKREREAYDRWVAVARGELGKLAKALDAEEVRLENLAKQIAELDVPLIDLGTYSYAQHRYNDSLAESKIRAQNPTALRVVIRGDILHIEMLLDVVKKNVERGYLSKEAEEKFMVDHKLKGKLEKLRGTELFYGEIVNNPHQDIEDATLALALLVFNGPKLKEERAMRREKILVLSISEKSEVLSRMVANEPASKERRSLFQWFFAQSFGDPRHVDPSLPFLSRFAQYWEIKEWVQNNKKILQEKLTLVANHKGTEKLSRGATWAEVFYQGLDMLETRERVKLWHELLQEPMRVKHKEIAFLDGEVERSMERSLKNPAEKFAFDKKISDAEKFAKITTVFIALALAKEAKVKADMNKKYSAAAHLLASQPEIFMHEKLLTELVRDGLSRGITFKDLLLPGLSLTPQKNGGVKLTFSKAHFELEVKEGRQPETVPLKKDLVFTTEIEPARFWVFSGYNHQWIYTKARSGFQNNDGPISIHINEVLTRLRAKQKEDKK